MHNTQNLNTARLADAWAELQAHSNNGLPLEAAAGSCQAICRQKRSAQRGFLGIGAGSGVSGLR